MSAFSFLAESVPPLVHDNGTGATSIGVWVLMAIMAGAAGLFIYNQVLSSQVSRKTLGAAPAHINAQPFIVALEKEFVNRAEYERRHSDVENQVKEARTYARDEVNEVRHGLQTMKNAGEGRDQLLHALDERTKTHTRLIDGMNSKLDRIVERISDKIEEVFKRRDGERNGK